MDVLSEEALASAVDATFDPDALVWVSARRSYGTTRAALFTLAPSPDAELPLLLRVPSATVVWPVVTFDRDRIPPSCRNPNATMHMHLRVDPATLEFVRRVEARCHARQEDVRRGSVPANYRHRIYPHSVIKTHAGAGAEEYVTVCAKPAAALAVDAATGRLLDLEKDGPRMAGARARDVLLRFFGTWESPNMQGVAWTFASGMFDFP